MYDYQNQIPLSQEMMQGLLKGKLKKNVRDKMASFSK